MKIRKRVVDIYDEEFSDLKRKLMNMSKPERDGLYKIHSERLFPKSKVIVNLEDQISGRDDYIHKFKKSFLIIGNLFFSTKYFGEYNQEVFINKIGYKSQRYPQKVILALSLMGYIKDMGCKYSVKRHGYIYKVDYWKYKKWSREFFVDMDLGNEADNHYPSEWDDDWLVNKQLDTIRKMTVPTRLFDTLMRVKDYYLGGNTHVDKEGKKILKSINEVENLYYKCGSYGRITIDGSEGRLYSIMTRMKSKFRHEGYFNINGIGFKEVDLSNSQPTLLGLTIKKRYPEFSSRWLDHCISGDFYEWVIDITGFNEYPIEHVLSKFSDSIIKHSKRKGMKEKTENDRKILCKVREIDSDDGHVKLRPLVKNWIMSFLYCKEKINRTRKDSDDIQSHFNHRLCKYLEEQEPLIFDEICKYRNNPEPKKKDPTKTSSQLARKLQEEEVRFIKECLKRLDKEIQYLYTVHDCVGCLESDADIVKSIMEQTSIDYYGVKLNLKVEGV